MGVTVHYTITSRVKSDERARELVDQMHKLAGELPFKRVHDVIELTGKECRVSRDQIAEDVPANMRLGYALGSRVYGHVLLPWDMPLSHEFPAEKIIGFLLSPGDGAETCWIYLARFPREVEVLYRPEDDPKRPRGARCERRKLTTGRYGWEGYDFCKTRYAGLAKFGGEPNLVASHVALVTLLERINQLPRLSVDMDDEGHYGPALYSAGWVDANREGREPDYVDHPATHSVQALIASTRVKGQPGAILRRKSCPSFTGPDDPRLLPYLQRMRDRAADHRRDEAHA